MYNKIFLLDTSVDEHESLLNNFDKKIFADKVINDTMQQEKLNPDVLKK
jgi:hypothetical protein